MELAKILVETRTYGFLIMSLTL